MRWTGGFWLRRFGLFRRDAAGFIRKRIVRRIVKCALNPNETGGFMGFDDCKMAIWFGGKGVFW